MVTTTPKHTYGLLHVYTSMDIYDMLSSGCALPLEEGHVEREVQRHAAYWETPGHHHNTHSTIHINLSNGPIICTLYLRPINDNVALSILLGCVYMLAYLMRVDLETKGPHLLYSSASRMTASWSKMLVFSNLPCTYAPMKHNTQHVRRNVRVVWPLHTLHAHILLHTLT